MRNFRELKVWGQAHQLTLLVYRATVAFPKEELYGLTNQIRRACASISANIAEGCGRSSKAEFAHFLQIALGSASEAEYHLLLVRDLGFLPEKEHAALETKVTEIKRMLTAFIQRLRADG